MTSEGSDVIDTRSVRPCAIDAHDAHVNVTTSISVNGNEILGCNMAQRRPSISAGSHRLFSGGLAIRLSRGVRLFLVGAAGLKGVANGISSPSALSEVQAC
jgi:hypothetical protein